MPRYIEETIDGRAVARRPAAVEGVADDRHRALGAERLHDLRDRDRAPEPPAFEVGAEVPEGQRGVGFALQRLLRQQRRSAIDDAGLPPEVETGAPCQRLQQNPALVEGAAGDSEALAPQMGGLAVGDCAGTMTAPSVLDDGEKTRLSPSARSRATHSQSDSIRSAEPPFSAILPA